MENQPVEILIQSVILHLEVIEKDLKRLDFAVKPIQSVVSKIQPIDFLKSLIEFY